MPNPWLFTRHYPTKEREEIMSTISPTKFAHVVYRTRRFEQMLQWYETVFGAKVRYQNPRWRF
jgi:hypothetical protein